MPTDTMLTSTHLLQQPCLLPRSVPHRMFRRAACVALAHTPLNARHVPSPPGTIASPLRSTTRTHPAPTLCAATPSPCARASPLRCPTVRAGCLVWELEALGSLGRPFCMREGKPKRLAPDISSRRRVHAGHASCHGMGQQHAAVGTYPVCTAWCAARPLSITHGSQSWQHA